MDFVTPLATAAAMALGPTLVRVWKKIEERDERKQAEWEAEQERRRLLKETRYTSATVDRLLLRHDREEK